MRKATLFAVLGVLLVAVAASAAQINVTVETDKASYLVGETVSWVMYAWSDPEAGNAGVSLLSLNLTEDQAETLSLPEIEDYLNLGIAFQFTGTGYGVADKYLLESQGVVSLDGNDIVDMIARQNENNKKYNIGNGGTPVQFAQGSYTATVAGMHTLASSVTAASHWPPADGDNIPDQSVAYTIGTLTDAVFEVTEVPEPMTLTLLGLGAGALAVIRRKRS